VRIAEEQDGSNAKTAMGQEGSGAAIVMEGVRLEFPPENIIDTGVVNTDMNLVVTVIQLAM
jgi:hypothetical protein